jgi:hypothetical protein
MIPASDSGPLPSTVALQSPLIPLTVMGSPLPGQKKLTGRCEPFGRRSAAAE